MNTSNVMPATQNVDMSAVLARMAQLEAANAELMHLQREADERARMVAAGAVQTSDGWIGKDRKRMNDSIRLSGFTEGVSTKGKASYMDCFPGAVHVGAKGMSSTTLEFTTYYASCLLRLLKSGELERVLTAAAAQHEQMMSRKAELQKAGIAGRSH